MPTVLPSPVIEPPFTISVLLLKYTPSSFSQVLVTSLLFRVNVLWFA